MLLQQTMDIGADETAPELARRMAELGAPLVVDSLRKLERGEISPRPQDHQAASYAPILKKEDGRIEWTRTAQQIYNRMRGFAPVARCVYHIPRANVPLMGPAPNAARPPTDALRRAKSFLSTKEVYVVCGEGTCLRLELVQLEGRKRISAREFANGARLVSSERFV